jgi:NAD(P)H-flavin reductase
MTAHLATLTPGAEVWVRGPYGRPVSGVTGCNQFILAGGGTGIASLLEIGAHLRRNQSSVRFALGARTKDELFRLDDFERLGSVSVSTDDGSIGYPGRVSELLRQLLAQTNPSGFSSLAVLNCGPEPMIRACAVVAGEYLPEDRIIGAVEYPTSCGVSICGKCASPSGHLSCIDGPFLPIWAFKPRQLPPTSP